MADKIKMDHKTLLRWADEMDAALKAITHIRTRPSWWNNHTESPDRVIERIAVCLRALTWGPDHELTEPVQTHMGHGTVEEMLSRAERLAMAKELQEMLEAKKIQEVRIEYEGLSKEKP